MAFSPAADPPGKASPAGHGGRSPAPARPRPAGLLPAALLSLAGLIVLPRSAPASNPHGFMADGSRCGDCHLETPVRVGGGFVRDMTSLCRECHRMDYRMSHPVEIRPDRMGRPLLPLDADGAMTCVTCHDPHAEPFSDVPFVRRGIVERIRGALSEDGHRTYFLRASNTEGQMCLACHDEDRLTRILSEETSVPPDQYAGSAVCGQCHDEAFGLWKNTPHARTLADPRENPAILRPGFFGDGSFRPQDVLFVVGARSTQRFVVERDGRLMVANGVWSLADRKWVASQGREQSWRESCAGCHITGYDPYSETLVEAGIGCEMCHGPGTRHARTREAEDIVNPARLDTAGRVSICAACHTHGHDRTGEFRYPVGYAPGRKLSLYYRGLIRHQGQGPDTFSGDGTLEDRLRSFGYWADGFSRHDLLSCSLCGGVPPFDDAEPADGSGRSHRCLECHPPETLAGKEHAVRSRLAPGCPSCHPPAAGRGGRPSVHDHKLTFVPITPG